MDVFQKFRNWMKNVEQKSKIVVIGKVKTENYHRLSHSKNRNGILLWKHWKNNKHYNRATEAKENLIYNYDDE